MLYFNSDVMNSSAIDDILLLADMHKIEKFKFTLDASILISSVMLSVIFCHEDACHTLEIRPEMTNKHLVLTTSLLHNLNLI
jgi:hypothetical protein